MPNRRNLAQIELSDKGAAIKGLVIKNLKLKLSLKLTCRIATFLTCISKKTSYQMDVLTDVPTIFIINLGFYTVLQSILLIMIFIKYYSGSILKNQLQINFLFFFIRSNLS